MNIYSERQATSPLVALDAQLAERPFGNSANIIEQLHVRYKRWLGTISAHLPVAGKLLDALCRADTYRQYRVIGDTVVRRAIQYALTTIKTGTQFGLPLEQCDEVFRATIRHLEEGHQCGPLGAGLNNRLGPDAHHGWIWSEERSDDVFARSFRNLVQNYFRGPLCTPGTDELAMLANGAKLLCPKKPLAGRVDLLSGTLAKG